MADKNQCIVKCQHCGNVIGMMMDVEGIALLQMGGGFCREWHGICAVCSQGMHWSVSEKRLKDLVDRLRSGENNNAT